MGKKNLNKNNDDSKLSYEQVKNSSLFNKSYKIVISLLGIIGAIITIYAFMFYEKKSNLEFQILSDINVLDLKEDVGKLDIIYDSTSLKKTKSNLKVFTLKIINTGNDNILIEYFDERSPIGLFIDSGNIVENPELIESSNKYLNEHFKINLDNEKRISFNKVIFEPGEFLTIKFLVLHDRNEIPKLISYGKIAGQKEINFINSNDIKNEESFFKSLYNGSILVNIVRGFIFLVIWIILIFAILSMVFSLYKKKDKRERNKIVERFKETKGYKYKRIDNVIFDRFILHDEGVLARMIMLCNSDDQLLSSCNKIFNENKGLLSTDSEDHISIYSNDSVFSNMIEDGVFYTENNKIHKNEQLFATLVDFYEFVTSLREKKK